jgi:7,8-dihydropterin-6-yl-methyl-4-(beta-D-ribofuranosyl)aminobenzene 5'-phosphate synthase
VAEHGFSALVTVFSGGRRSSILYDGGLTPHGLANNLDILQVDPAELRAIVVSHGHVDHHGGLEGLAARTGRRLPPPSRADLEAEDLRWWRSAARPCCSTARC